MNNIFETAGNEVLARLTHESCWVVDVSADLSVNFDESLHDDLGDFGVGQSVLQAIAQENHQRQ